MSKYSSPYMKGSAADVMNRSAKKEHFRVNRTFYAKTSEYRYPNGKLVSAGTPIRQLNNGTVMSGHRHTKSSQVIIPIRTPDVRKQLGIDKRGKSIVSKQKPSNVVKRKETLTNNELDIAQGQNVNCDSNMNYAQCRQYLLSNIPREDYQTFTTWYDVMGNDGYQQVLTGQVTRLEQLSSIQRLQPSGNTRGQGGSMADNPNLLFCMGCNGVYGFGRCSGTCCGVTTHDVEEVVDPYTNEVIIEGSTQHGVGCNMTL